MERKFGRITLLHRAAYHGVAKTVKRLLEVILEKWTSEDETTKQKAEQVVNYMARDDEGFTPLYIAATLYHKEVCNIMLHFLKRVLQNDQLRKNLTEENGFVYNALWEAIQYFNQLKFQVILTCVAESLGGDYLFDLLDAKIPSESGTSIFTRTVTSWTGSISFIQTLIDKAYAQDEGKVYGRLNDLFFHEARSLRASDYISFNETLKNIDAQTLEKMLAVIGCKEWTKSLLDANLVYGFQIIIPSFFGKLENDKLSEIVNIITTTATSSGRNRSYWAEWVDYLFSDRKYGEKLYLCSYFLQQVSINLGENTAKDLVLHDNGKAITRNFLMCRDESIVRDALINCFSAENQSEFAKCILDCAPELITELFLGFEQETRRIDAENNCIYMSVPRLRWMNILDFVIGYADTTQLCNLVNAILTQCDLNGRQISIWADYLRI